MGWVLFNGGNKIVFDKVNSNVGNGYDNTTGIFTTPRNGTYTFTLVTMSNSGDQYTWITVNGNRLSKTYGASGYRSGKLTYSHTSF